MIDAKSGVSGAGRSLKPSSHAGFVLENLAPYRVGAHQHAPEIAQALGFPVCFVPHLLPVRRGLLVTCYARATGDGLRDLLAEAYADSPVVRLLPKGVAPELARACRGPTLPRSRCSRTSSPARRSSSARSTTSARARRTGSAERQPGTRPRRNRGAASAGVLVSVTAATGFLASAVHAGIRRSKPDIALVRSAVPATGTAMFTRNRMQAAPVVVSKRHLELAEPQAVVVNSGVANAATGAQGERDAHADRRARRAPAPTAAGRGARPFDGRDRRPTAAREGARGRQRFRLRFRRTATARRTRS